LPFYLEARQLRLAVSTSENHSNIAELAECDRAEFSGAAAFQWCPLTEPGQNALA